MIFRLFVLAICFCYSALLFAANQPQSIYDYDIKQWTSVDGLSNNSVRAITQDRQGYLWIGTLTGLNRFDGNRFEVFTSQNSRHLVSNAITRLMTDSQGYVWIGTRSGLSGLNTETLKFDRYSILAEVTAIVEVEPDEIWVAADHLFRIKAGKISRVDEIKEQVSQLEATAEYIWVTSNKWLYKIDRAGTVAKMALPTDIAQRPVYDLLMINDKLHLATEQGYFHLEDGVIERCTLPVAAGTQVYKLFHDHQNSDWVSSFSQLFHRHQGQAWQVISRDDLGSSTLFNDIYQDKQQNVWLGSFSDGLYRASRSKIKRVLAKGSKDDVVRSVALGPDQRLLVATQSNLSFVDENHQFSPIQLSSGEPLTIVQDMQPDGRNWLLATDTGPMQLDLEKGALQMLDPSLRGVKTRVIKPRSAGGYWLGTANGLYSYDQQLLQPSAANKDLESSVITFIDDRTDKILLGTTRGGYQYQQQKLVRLGLGTPLYNAFISNILLLKDGTLLVATLDDGLFIRHFDGKWQQFDRANGLPYEPVVSLIADEISGFVWASTLEGIFRFHPADVGRFDQNKNLFEQVLTPYDRQLGTAPGRCCNGFGHSKVALFDQRFWYPTLKGMVTVPLNVKTVVNQYYQPLIQKISATEQYLLEPTQQRLVLDTDERNLTVHYTAIEFLMPAAQEFRYKLQGFDADWHHVGSRREAIYTNLPPGSYVFQLQSRLNNQNWDLLQPTELTLVIPKRFDETAIYRGLWLLLVMVILYGLFWLFRRNNQAREISLTKLVKQRTLELENSNLKLNELNEQLSQLTHKDPLTGLRNRRFMFEQLPKDIEHYQRNRDSMLAQNKCIALIQLDLDHFKLVNDKYGNSAGDGLLQQISGLLIRETRGSDYVVRYAGEQFMLVLRDTPQDLVKEFALRLNELIAMEPFQLPDGRVVRVNCSVGYAIYPLELLGGQLIGWEISLQLAELALFHVKNSGRNGVATILFDQQVDAFEFEDSKHIEAQVEKFLADGVAWFELSLGKVGQGRMIEMPDKF
jgi:diguanylate cyclase (GGDEF)-like protein